MSKSLKQNPDNSDELIKALGDPLRTRILKVLSNEKICVCDLADSFGISRNLLSFHLKKLANVELLKVERDGNRIFYVINGKYKNLLKEYLNLLNIN
ncbi:winged helix-turn-helix transcriptional regulator [Candidatus Dojkabacteria bacterium]|uniref:Winged helix-turn-helix transcriptional regulator n=1 Tax=Candidatus Dojkabacteria bacterium TaxID=2099670 RepID=A0A955I9T9_9BACT|nr:winged helix-turn-helix transcriptional regulator [Candidatus Dojkabacteria bacterium]